MEDRLCFVQFFHPGNEAVPTNGRYTWNEVREGNTHRRRFIKQNGEYLDSNNERHRDRDIVFWGEWEAQGNAINVEQEHWIDGVNDGPRFVCEPWYRPVPGNGIATGSCSSTANGGCMNTDPFVFGDRFIYSNCQQRAKSNPSQLQFLSPGSVILFGSHKVGKFHLDTVFVVDHNESHRYRLSDEDHRNNVARLTSDAFMHVTAEHTDTNPEYTLHRGATFDERNPDRPFSFVPCLPAEARPGGFVRPVIELEHIVRDEMTQKYALNTYDTEMHEAMSVERATELWRQVREQVEKQHLCLGIRFDLPPRHDDV